MSGPVPTSSYLLFSITRGVLGAKGRAPTDEAI